MTSDGPKPSFTDLVPLSSLAEIFWHECEERIRHPTTADSHAMAGVLLALPILALIYKYRFFFVGAHPDTENSPAE